MGLSSLDVNEASQDAHGPGSGTATSEYEAAKRAAGIPTESQPKVLSMGRGKGLGGLLSSPIYAARFKLDSLSNELLEPLSDLLKKKDYLLEGDKPSSLDCLAFGYLALMLYTPVPQAWLKETIQAKYPKINRYIRRLREELLGNEDIKPAEVWSIASGQANTPMSLKLPWAPRPSQAVVPQLAAIVDDLVTSSVLQRGPTVQHEDKVQSKRPTSSLPSALVMNTLAAVTATVTVGLAGLAIQHRRSPREGPLIFWALRPQPNSNVFSTDSFLGVLGSQLPRQPSGQF